MKESSEKTLVREEYTGWGKMGDEKLAESRCPKNGSEEDRN